MRLRVVTPSQDVLDCPVLSLVAEGRSGRFGLLPQHVDMVEEIVPSVVAYRTPENREAFIAISEGTLIKCGAEVTVAAHDAVLGDDLADLQARVRDVFRSEDEGEREARAALARLEANMVRRFRDLEGAAT